MRVLAERDLLVCPPTLSFSIDRYEQSTDDVCIDSCTCEKVEKIDAAVQEGLETDFTTKA